jgi:hypothetical protein
MGTKNVGLYQGPALERRFHPTVLILVAYKKAWLKLVLFSSSPKKVKQRSQKRSYLVLPMKFTIVATTTAVLPLFLAQQALAICPGFNFGIGNVQNLGNGISRCKFTFFFFCALKNDGGLYIPPVSLYLQGMFTILVANKSMV